MDIFYLLFTQLVPLFFLVAMGWLAGRHLGVNLHSMAIVSINLIAPVVAFGAVGQMDFKSEYILFMALMAIISVFMSLSNYFLGRYIFGCEKIGSLVGMASANGNTGYFGLPIVLLLFGAEGVGIYLVANLGSEIVTLTLGYYLGAKGGRKPSEAIKIVLRLPIIYAMLAGFLWNITIDEFPTVFLDYWNRFTGAWIIIGMLLIGVGLGKLNWSCIQPKVHLWMLVSRMVVWPLIAIGFILFDQTTLHIFDARVHTLLLIFGTVPVSGNLVAFASKLDLKPSEATFAVLVSTLIAMVSMPAIFVLMKAPF